MQSIPEYQRIYLQNMTRRNPLRLRGAMGGAYPPMPEPSFAAVSRPPKRQGDLWGSELSLWGWHPLGKYTLERLCWGVGISPAIP